jgi:tetratricopeptide (TPR) repeat protein
MRLPRVVLYAGLTIALCMTMVAPAHSGGTNDARFTGIRLYQQGKFQEAIPYFDQVLAAHKRDLEILIKRGACYLHTNQPLDALEDFNRVNEYSRWASGALNAGPAWTPLTTWIPTPATDVMFAESWGNRGIALLMVGRDEEALESFRTAVYLWKLPQNQPNTVLPGNQAKIVRSHAGAYQGFGQAYHRLGQDEQAYQAYSQAIAIDPSDANGFAGRGQVLNSLKLLDAADADLTEAIRLDSTNSRAFCWRGIVRSDLRRDDLALADFDQSIALDPKFALAYSYRGGVHARRAENDRALADYDALIRLLPDNAGAYKDRGGVLVRMRRFEPAVLDLSEAIRLDPKRASAYQNRGAAYNGLGQYERAIDDLSQAIELSRTNSGAYTNRGLAYFSTGQYDRAVADLSEAIALAPQHPVPYFNRAEVFARLGLRQRAIEDYDTASRLDPHLSAAVVASGRLREQTGRPERAIRDFDMALQLSPKEVALYYDRGNARRESGDWQGALADYDRAIVLAPQQAETYVARGWSRLVAGVEGADFDALVYLKLRGWHDWMAHYMAILAAVAARDAQRPADAEHILDEGLANLSPRAWPVPILRYLRGQMTETTLLDAASDDRTRAEAHAFLGLERLRAGDRTTAMHHLIWARDHGAPGSIGADVSRAKLARLNPTNP